MPKTLKRNDPCHCGSGKKYKKCHMRRDDRIPEIKGIFDPDLPISDKGGEVGNHLSNGHWYVIRSGHGHGRTPPLEGERLERAGHMISDWKKRRLERLQAEQGGLGATLAAASIWGNVK
jgi:hypothetical protein